MKWIIVLVSLTGHAIDQQEFSQHFFDTKAACEAAKSDIDFIASKLDPQGGKEVRTECRLSDDMT